MKTIAEVMEYGPILAVDEETGMMVTGNGSYYSLWVRVDESHWTAADACTVPKDMYQQTAADFWDGGKSALQDWLE